jgi:hypothetical protein
LLNPVIFKARPEKSGLFFLTLKTYTMQLELFEHEKQYKVCHMAKDGSYKETKYPLNEPSAKRYLKFILDACPWIEQAWITEIKKPVKN